MAEQRTVLVSGATGKQGGAVARALLAGGHAVVALSRTPEGDAARRLAAEGAKVVAGDFDTPDTLAAALGGVDTVFAMSTPFGTSPEAETRQGRALVDAAAAAGIGHVILSSVAGADQATGVPHFDSKFAVEQHLAASGLGYTISAPVAFMDFTSPMFLEGLRQGELRMGLPATRKLQYVSVRDVGAFAAELVERREAVFGQRFEIAGDELTGEEAAAVLSRASGRAIRYAAVPPAAYRAFSEDIALMFEWLDRVGYGVDRAAVARAFPAVGWQTLEDWARGQDWDAALSGGAGL